MSNKNTLVAGRPLDGIIAEKIMGFERIDWKDGQVLRSYWKKDGKSYVDFNSGFAAQYDPSPLLPFYSTDAGEALKILDSDRFRKCWHFNLYRGDGLDSSDESHLFIATFNAPGCEIEVMAETAALAICSAALAVVSTRQ